MPNGRAKMGKNVKLVVKIFVSTLPLFVCHIHNTDKMQSYAQEVKSQQASIWNSDQFFNIHQEFNTEKQREENKMKNNVQLHVQHLKPVHTKIGTRSKRAANNSIEYSTTRPANEFSLPTTTSEEDVSLDFTPAHTATDGSIFNLLLPINNQPQFPLNKPVQPSLGKMTSSPNQTATDSFTITTMVQDDNNETDSVPTPAQDNFHTDSHPSPADVVQTEQLHNKTSSKANSKVDYKKGYKTTAAVGNSSHDYYKAIESISENTQQDLHLVQATPTSRIGLEKDNQTINLEIIVRKVFCYQIQCGLELGVSLNFNVEPTVVPLGTNVTFECNVAAPANNNLTIWWTRRHSSAYGAHDQHIPLEHLKEEIIPASGTSNETVTIISVLERSNVSFSDSGYYTCSVQLQAQCCHVNETTQLIAYHPPHHNTDLIIIVCVCILQALIILFVYTKSRQISRNEPTIKDMPLQTFQYKPIKNLSSIEEGEPEDNDNDNEFEDDDKEHEPKA